MEIGIDEVLLNAIYLLKNVDIAFLYLLSNLYAIRIYKQYIQYMYMYNIIYTYTFIYPYI